MNPALKKSLLAASMLACALTGRANPPAWWGVGNPPVIIPSAASNNHGPANIGQAKHMAKSALDALASVLPDVAIQVEADLCGPGKPIPNWDPPADQAARDKNHAPLLTGQLKAIAHPFYAHLHVAAPVWLAEQRAANGTESGGIFPWTDAPSDDNHHGMANLGQLKAVFSLHFTHDTDDDGLPDLIEHAFGTNPNQAMTFPGIPDAWIKAHFPASQGFDPNADPDGDGINNAQENQLGLDPNNFDRIGPVNLGFDEQITDSPDMSFRETMFPYPSDLYDQTSIPGYLYGIGQTEGWQANTGSHIEIWNEGVSPPSTPSPTSVSPYVELQSHMGAHGIKQEFNMLPGTRLNFILCYKGRYYWETYENAFDLKVEGASAMLVNGNPATASGGTLSHAFMEDDDGENYGDWHYASVSITADSGSSGLTKITLSLVPATTTSGTEEITYGGFVDLIPVELAPEVVAVNSDFDEGRIDPETGYAIPDCDDADIALEAVKNHLDGKYSIDDRITEDMHTGFFGVKPTSLSDEFWADATVTIRKIDRDDPATGHPESGHVRLYGKWGDGASEYRAIVPYDFETLVPTPLTTGGINGASAESVYGAASPFPDGTSYYIEGVHPGKITLEWRYQKDSIDLKDEQIFEVCTQKKANEWNHDLAYKIRLETDNDPSGQVDIRNVPLPSEDYWKRMERLSEYYDFYQECYREPLRSHRTGPANVMSWPGLARLAGSQVVAGLSDSEYARQPVAGLTWLTADETSLEITEQLIKDIQHELFFGGKEIFRSIGWQMHAFRSSGFWALDWVADNDPINEEAFELRRLGVWRNLYDGIKQNDVTLLNLSAEEITNREQNVTIVETWDHINSMVGGHVSSLFSYLAKNSMYPLGDDFRDLFPAPKQMTYTADRWDWIKPSTPTGILNTWNTAPITTKNNYVYRHLTTDATRFSLAQVTTGHPITGLITVPLPILCNDDKDVP